jgi:hypothetical protein
LPLFVKRTYYMNKAPKVPKFVRTESGGLFGGISYIFAPPKTRGRPRKRPRFISIRETCVRDFLRRTNADATGIDLSQLPEENEAAAKQIKAPPSGAKEKAVTKGTALLPTARGTGVERKKKHRKAKIRSF